MPLPRNHRPRELPDGYLIVSPATDPDWFTGFDETHVVANEEDIRLRYHDHTQPVLECDYCGDTARLRSFNSAVQWFRAHDCPPQLHAEAAGIVHDLTRLAA